MDYRSLSTSRLPPYCPYSRLRGPGVSRISHFLNNRNRINGEVPPLPLLDERTGIRSSTSNNPENLNCCGSSRRRRPRSSRGRRNGFPYREGRSGRRAAWRGRSPTSPQSGGQGSPTPPKPSSTACRDSVRRGIPRKRPRVHLNNDHIFPTKTFSYEISGAQKGHRRSSPETFMEQSGQTPIG